MKNFAISAAAILVLMVSCKSIKQAVTHTVSINAVANQTPLATGVYYIISGTGQALTPLDATPGNNVFLRPFNRSGLQQWLITKKGTGKTISYTIRLAGEVDGLWFQTYPVKDHTPIVGSASGNVSYRIVPVQGKTDSWYIKSNRYNGDALHTYVFSPQLPTELRYDPEEQSPKFMWQFEVVNQQ